MANTPAAAAGRAGAARVEANLQASADGSCSVVEAEHRQRERHQADREGAQHPRVLQGRGEALAGQPGGDAEQRCRRRPCRTNTRRRGAKPRPAGHRRGSPPVRRRCPRPRARRRRRRPWPAWPTMIDETMGSIGSTQGVSESSRPATKKAPTIDQNVPPRSTDSIAPSSPPAAVDGARARRQTQAGAAACRRTSTLGRRDDAAAAEARQADVRAALHRRIAQARVGAALAGGRRDESGAGARITGTVIFRCCGRSRRPSRRSGPT